MFAKLGEIIFKLMTGPESLSIDKTYNYAEHAVIEGKPKLQYTGESLEAITFSINLHSIFCNPDTEFEYLKTEAEKYEPLSFVFANGKNLGKFVIESVKKGLDKTDGEGNTISINAEISLKEWVETEEIKFAREKTIKISKAKKRAKTSSAKKKGRSKSSKQKFTPTVNVVNGPKGPLLKQITRQPE
ncbi:MAG: phage tail protein [Candidatus Abawacabacteria bacterium]|nr:phage tail protein [Candidatus Abawacabacteria bacterium]